MFLTFIETKQLVIVSKNSQFLLFILFVVQPNVCQLKVFVLIVNRQQLNKHHFYSLEYLRWWSRIKRMCTFLPERNLFQNIKRGLKRRNKSKLEEKRKLFLVHY